MQTNQIKVFLSYSREDEKEISYIENVLAELGINRENMFKDTISIQAGDNWKDTIISAIRDANLCVFLWTKNVKGSAVIKSERSEAHNTMKRISFDNSGRGKKRHRLYKIIHVIAEDLDYSSRKELWKYGDIQQLRFQNRTTFFKQVGVRLISALKNDGMTSGINDLEVIENACYRCGRAGHSSSECYAKSHVDGSYLDDSNEDAEDNFIEDDDDACYRCGYSGHFSSECYAKRHIDGSYLGDSEDDFIEDDACHRCGYSGHFSSECYAKRHVDGYFLN